MRAVRRLRQGGKSRGKSRGQSLVEFALIVPLMMTL